MNVLTVLTAAAALSPILGSWHGELKISPQTSLNIVLHFQNDSTATLDSPDQGATGIPANLLHLSADSVSVAVPQIAMTYRGRLNAGKLVGTFSQGGLSLPLEMDPGELKLDRPQTPQPPFPYSTRECYIEIPTDSTTLAATLTLPDNYNADTPAMLLISGSGAQNRDEELFGHKPFAVLADRLARAGIASLRYDDRGTGQTVSAHTDVTTARLTLDAAEALDFLRRQGFRKTGVLGHSEGGMIAFLMAADSSLKARPDFIVTLGAPALDGTSVVLDQMESGLKTLGATSADIEQFKGVMWQTLGSFSRGDGTDLTAIFDSARPGRTSTSFLMNAVYDQTRQTLPGMDSQWMRYFLALDPASAISKTHCPALVLYGEKDTQVRPSLHRPLMEKLAPSADIRTYPGLNHLMQPCETGTAEEYPRIAITIDEQVLSDIASGILQMAK